MVIFLLKSDLLVFRTSGIHWSILSACWGYYTAVMLHLFYGVMLRRFKTSLSRSVKHGPWRAILLSNKLSKNWYFTRSGISAQLCLCCVCLNKVPRGPTWLYVGVCGVEMPPERVKPKITWMTPLCRNIRLRFQRECRGEMCDATEEETQNDGHSGHWPK